jgi:hypothetical protein
MSESELQTIVEEIGQLADTAETSRWKVAQAISEAYSELPAYSHGLTSGLCVRLKRSTDSIYAIRDAYDLKSKLRYDSEITVSHFSTLAHLQKRYELDDDTCRSWLDWVQETDASVREMSSEISMSCEADQRQEWFRKIERLVKLMTTIYRDAAGLGMPEEYYKSVVDIGVAIDDWKAKIDKWMK